MPSHRLFQPPNRGQEMLYNILRAYSIYDDEIGYSQGMGFIAATIMLHIEDEEMAFWMFVRLMFGPDFNWRLLFHDSNTAMTRWYTYNTINSLFVLPFI
jgi:CRISPR/Cas system CSM-associated protein Csm5 (group 7 of RAMP superfamily)